MPWPARLTPTLSVAGVSVLTNGQTGFADENDAPLSAAAFFTGAEGRLVQIKGIWSGAELIAEEAEFE